MASAVHLRSYINDITKCPICLEDFDKPRILPCVHTFCLNCLVGHCKDKFPGDNVECPVCRNSFQLPPSGVDGLQHNFFLEDLVAANLVASDKKRNGAKCEGCDGDRAAVYCVVCCQKLCTNCGSVHRKWRGRPHQVVPLGEEVQSELLRLRGRYCDEHGDETVKLYCNDCNEVICVMCFALKHQKHECQEISQVAKDFSRQIQMDIKAVNDSFLDCQKESERLKNDKKDFETRADRAEMKIKERGEQTKLHVDQQVRELIRKVRKDKSQVQKQILARQENTELALVAMESFVKYSQELVNKGSPCDVTRAASDLHSRAGELQKMITVGDYCVPAISYEATNVDSFLQPEVRHVGKTSARKSAAADNIKRRTNTSGDVSRRVVYYGVNCVIAVISCLTTLNFILPTDYPSCLQYLESPPLIASLPTECTAVGVTELDDEVYVACENSSTIKRFTSGYRQRHGVRVDGLSNPIDIAACKDSKMIYVADVGKNCVWRVAEKLEARKFVSNVRPRSLSVTSGRLLVTSENKIRLYGPGGEQLKQVSLPPAVVEASHAVQTNDGTFFVSHFGSRPSNRTQHNVSEVDSNGHVIRTSTEPLNWPAHLALDDSGRVILADRDSHRVLLMNKQLQPEQVLLSIELGEIEYPYRLCYVTETGSLLVAQHTNRSVKVYDLQ